MKVIYHRPDAFDGCLFQEIVDRALEGKEVFRCPEVCLKQVPGLEENTYRLSGTEDAYLLESADKSGFFLGLGELLRKVVCRNTPSVELGVRCPAKHTRGIYFATHFHNYYHDAPVEEVLRYLEELALWGQNSLMLWFDMHHYDSVRDPQAQEMICRLKRYITHAHLLGMKVTMLMLGNESFRNSPVQLRAAWEPRGNYVRKLTGHYHIEICPSKQGGIDAILRMRREVLSQFLDAQPDAMLIFPYDQGGCTCEECEPWGVNGFLRVSRAVKGLVKEMFPNIKVGLSCWMFDSFIRGESKVFYEMFKDSSEFDYLMCYPFPDGVGSDFAVPLLGFPEISMPGAVPWGGFGANPVPRRIEKEWLRKGTAEDGGFPYSEGIFEDMNKIAMLTLYSGETETVEDAFRAYIRFYFGEEFEEEIWEIVRRMESTLKRHRYDELGKIHDYATFKEPWVGDQRFVITEPQYAEEIYRRMLALCEKLPERTLESWRFAILKYRAIIDYELVAHDYFTSDTTEQCYKRLTGIYHAENADYVVAPPTLETIRINRGGFE